MKPAVQILLMAVALPVAVAGGIVLADWRPGPPAVITHDHRPADGRCS